LLHTAEPTKVEEGICDMLLESLSRQQIRKFMIDSFPSVCKFTPRQVRFLTENEELKDIDFIYVDFSGEACEAFSRIPHCLEKFDFMSVSLVM
jgi:hypothetical protein